MSEKTPFWKQPQNYIIAILLLGIAGYIGYQQLQPKTNKLAQASAYFDAIDAEERAEAEKKRAAEEKEKARLAAIEMEKAKEEARIAQQKVKEASRRAQVQSTARAESGENTRAPSRYELVNESACHRSDQVIQCSVTCRDQYGQSFTQIYGAYYVSSARQWFSNNVAGSFYSPSSVFSAICRNH